MNADVKQKQAKHESHDDVSANSDQWQDYAETGVEQIRDMVRDNAGRSMLIAMGAGLGLGVLLGTSLGGSKRSSRWFNRSTAEGLGRSLLERVEGLIPDNISDRFNG